MSMADDLGNRMKSRYEDITRYHLVGRMPVIIRIDGKAFHTFTKGFISPFDDFMSYAMVKTTQKLCESIQGCVFGYTQSDEISLLLVDYKNLESTSWFDNNIQKMASISASMATFYFNKFFAELLDEDSNSEFTSKERIETYKKALDKGAMFDSRVFNVPKEDVTNYFYWRQLDAMKNAVSQVARHYFSDKELFKKSTADKKAMLKETKDVDFDNDIPNRYRVGVAVRKMDVFRKETGTHIPKFVPDNQTPKFSGENRKYIDETFMFDSEDGK